MMLLATDVVAELMKPAPAPAVARWVAGRPVTSVYTTAITQGEILGAIRRLASGKRRTALQSAAEAMFREDFAGRVLPFGAEAAASYAQLTADRAALGLPIGAIEAQIAAIADSVGATLVTGNPVYARCGVSLVDPWRP
jgi:predicted nucleic acid-binding protein